MEFQKGIQRKCSEVSIEAVEQDQSSDSLSVYDLLAKWSNLDDAMSVRGDSNAVEDSTEDLRPRLSDADWSRLVSRTQIGIGDSKKKIDTMQALLEDISGKFPGETDAAVKNKLKSMRMLLMNLQEVREELRSGMRSRQDEEYRESDCEVRGR